MFKKALVMAGVAVLTAVPAFAGDCKDCDCGCSKKLTKEQKQEKMQQMIEEIDARLQLTDEQKVQVAALREAKAGKMAAQKEKIEALKAEACKVKESNASQAAKDKKLAKIKEQKKAVKCEIKAIHDQFMADFKAILTEAQQAELDKIKQEQKAKFEAKKESCKEK